MMSLSPFTRRILALALVIFPVAYVLLYVAIPITETFQENSDKIRQNRFLLARFNAVTVRQPAIRPEDLKANTDEQKKNFIEGRNETLALASLQARLKSLAATNQTGILQSNQLARKREGSLDLIGVRIEFRGTQKNIQKIVHEIETMRPYLFIENFHLNAGPSGYTGQHSEDLVLTARLHVYGAFWTGESQ